MKVNIEATIKEEITEVIKTKLEDVKPKTEISEQEEELQKKQKDQEEIKEKR